MAALQALYHLNALTENNIGIYRDYYASGYIFTMRIDRLGKADFENETVYEEVKILADKGFEKYLLHKYAALIDFEDWFALDSIIRRNNENHPQDRHFFDIGRIPEGSRVVLYGAGKRGRDIYEMNKKTNKYNLAAWVDKNADSIGVIDGIKIQNPDIITKMDFDYIILGIGATRVDTVEEITDALSVCVDREKIVW